MALELYEIYLGTLDEEDLDDILLAIDSVTAQKLRYAVDLELNEDIAVDNLDEILTHSPKVDKDFTLFTQYQDQGFRKGGKLEDPAYITGTTKLPSGGQESGTSVTLAIRIPKGSQALYMGEDSWILPRGLTLLLREAETGPIEAKIQ